MRSSSHRPILASSAADGYWECDVKKIKAGTQFHPNMPVTQLKTEDFLSILYNKNYW